MSYGRFGAPAPGHGGGLDLGPEHAAGVGAMQPDQQAVLGADPRDPP